MTKPPKPSQPSHGEGSSRHKGAAERDLRAREQGHDDLDLKPQTSTARQQYTQGRSSLQEHSVNRPERRSARRASWGVDTSMVEKAATSRS